MSVSIIEICNSALFKLGAERISSFSEDRKEAILCAEQYDKIRRKLLRGHPWNFAMKRVSLARLPETPEFDFASQFALPQDVLRVIRVDDNKDFVIEGRLLLSDQDEMRILYIADIQDTAKFDPTFAEVLAYKLAEDLAYPLVQSIGLKQEMARAATEELRDARSFDGQEGTQRMIQDDVFLNSRFGGDDFRGIDLDIQP